MRGSPDRMEGSFDLRYSSRIVAWMESEGFLEYEAGCRRLDVGVEQQTIQRHETGEHPQHPFGVGRFVDSNAWMTSINRLGGDLPLKYRSSPNLKLYSHPPDDSPPSSLPPALIPDRIRQPTSLPPGLSSSPSVMGHHHQQKAPNAMARRNERERKRVRLVNHGFATLRQYLPQGNTRKKQLSKMETLRSAIEYIKQLQFLLEPSVTGYDQNSSHSDDGRWPGMTSDGSSSMTGQVWEEAISWTPRSPGSAGSSPHTSLSPETDLIDFSTFS